MNKPVSPVFTPLSEEKNTAKREPDFLAPNQAISLYRCPFSSESVTLQGMVPAGLIQFYLCLEGSMKWVFGGGRYEQELGPGKMFLMYNPKQSLSFELIHTPQTKGIKLFTTVEQLHELFLEDSSELTFLTRENIDKKFYSERPLSPLLKMVLDQFFNPNLIPSNRRLYFQAKTFELLSLLFNKEESSAEENCPFLLDEANVEKIRLAKRIVIERMTHPPQLKELAREVGLNEYQLKAGFKNIYGSPVFQFLTDYKMEHARKLLDSGNYKVNEVGFMVGYSNPSHFIAAFKRKFGITPKKYSMALK